VGSIDRLISVFSFDFDAANPLSFTQLNFWVFFLAVFTVFTLLELSRKTKLISFLAIILIGLTCFQYFDTAILLSLVGINYFLFKESFPKKWQKWLTFSLVNGAAIGYYGYKMYTQHFILKLSAYDCWILFLGAVFLLSRFKDKFWVRSFFLTGVSLFFYYKSSELFVLLLGLSLVVNYFMGKWIFSAETILRKKWIIGFSAIFNILILGYFKYAYFFTDAYNELFNTDFKVINQFAYWANGFWGDGTFSERIMLPVGVSFFTFQSISYVVDIYRKEIEPVKSFFDYTFFVTFFPQLVAGPIVRARDFIPQIHQPYQLDNKDFSWAIVQIIKGLLKKVVLADYIAIHFIDLVAEAPETYPGFVSILAMWGYSLQIYGDFSGYTDIAIGISRLMGFKLLENFNSPYKAINVADFWRRWHKSLGSWLRDYLYIPLGGNRTGGIGTYIASTVVFIFLLLITKWYELIFVYLGLMILYIYGVLFVKNFKKLIHRDLNLLITMVVGGLWHGASENFVIWGAMNGLALIIYNYWKKVSPYEDKKGPLVHFWKIFITFNFITFTRIWFRLEGDGQPIVMLNQIIYHFDFSWTVFKKVISTYDSVFIVMLIGYIIHWLPGKIKLAWEYQFERFSLPMKVLSVSVILVAMYQAISDVSKPFVYFQF
jgi:D-alanyl-lipoteichoic acid acyltransferase DltB (MBOAT superfamily)